MGHLAICNATTMCDCKSNPGFIDGKCYRPAAVGQICEDSNECKLFDLNSHCILEEPFMICRCLSSLVEYENKCYKALSLGEECNDDNECKASITGEVFCNASVCTCGSFFKEANDGKECVLGFNGAQPVGNSVYGLLVALLVTFVLKV